MSKIEQEQIRSYLEHYPVEIVAADEPAEVYDRYHAPGHVLVSDGLPLDRERLLAHVAPARRRVAAVRVTVHDVVTSDARFAARYTLDAEMRKGAVVSTEIAVFGEVDADGRIRSGLQLTRDVSARASTS